MVFLQQHVGHAAKRFDINAMRRELADDPFGQVELVAIPGDSDFQPLSMKQGGLEVCEVGVMAVASAPVIS